MAEETKSELSAASPCSLPFLLRVGEPIAMWLALFAATGFLFHVVEGSKDVIRSIGFACLSASVKSIIVCLIPAMFKPLKSNS